MSPDRLAKLSVHSGTPANLRSDKGSLGVDTHVLRRSLCPRA